MKSITIILITVLLVPIAATASTTDPDLSYIVEVCQKAFPQDESETAKCVLKAAGLDAPAPTQVQVNAMYGAPDDPVRVQRLHREWTEQLNGHLESYKACKGQPDWQRCLGEASRQEVAIHEKLMDALKPPAWPSTLGLRYFVVYSLDEARTKVLQCNMPSETERDKCVKKIADEGYHAGMQAALHKAHEHMIREERRQATYQREILSREQQLREEEHRAQRAHEMELARIQALGMILGSGGLQFQPPHGQLYTPPPPIPAPEIPKTRNCTSSVIGNQVYTSCY